MMIMIKVPILLVWTQNQQYTDTAIRHSGILIFANFVNLGFSTPAVDGDVEIGSMYYFQIDAPMQMSICKSIFSLDF